jgi:ribulose-5-phosphate 4-epimerase/fuculose-1-phosphate aldolase
MFEGVPALPWVSILPLDECPGMDRCCYQPSDQLRATHKGNLGEMAKAPSASALARDSQLVENPVYANRILYDQNIIDGFGHVSVRDNKDSSRFLLACSRAPALVTSSDILKFGMDGEAIDPRGRALYLERFIHAAIYRARPDANAVVHSHSQAVIPFGVTATTLRPIYHTSGFLGEGAPIFEIRDTAGVTDPLIRNNELGDASQAFLVIARPS